jgi:hypothetical protein
MKALPKIIPPGPAPARTGDGSPYPYDAVPTQELTGSSFGEIVDGIIGAIRTWPAGQIADAVIIIEDDDGRHLGHVQFDIRPVVLMLYLSSGD